MAQTVRIRRFESKKENAHKLESNVNEFIYGLERYGNGVEDVKTEFYQTDEKIGIMISYKLKE